MGEFSTKNIQIEVKENLIKDILKLSEWFYENWMILKPNNCHYILFGKDTVGDLRQICAEDLITSIFENVL